MTQTDHWLPGPMAEEGVEFKVACGNFGGVRIVLCIYYGDGFRDVNIYQNSSNCTFKIVSPYCT